MVGGAWDHSKRVLGFIVLSRACRKNSQIRSQRCQLLLLRLELVHNGLPKLRHAFACE